MLLQQLEMSEKARQVEALKGEQQKKELREKTRDGC